jgi:peptidyl-prolyl cis-trans isomerase B (cyclophilin B)
MRRWLILLLVIAVLLALGTYLIMVERQKNMDKKNSGDDQVTEVQKPALVAIETPRGRIVVEVRPDITPLTSNNFLKLVDSGFYNGLTIHRVEGWVVQGGDPNGDGTGGPGWTIKLEINQELKNIRGALAMAHRNDPDTAGSQFFILKQDAPHLDGRYAVFGRVVQGMDVVDRLEIGDQMIAVKRTGPK